MKNSEVYFNFECDVITPDGCFPSLIEGSAKVQWADDILVAVYDGQIDSISTVLLDAQKVEHMQIDRDKIKNWDYIRQRICEICQDAAP